MEEDTTWDQSEFNQSIAYLMRLDEILRNLNAYYVKKNKDKVYLLLNCFFKELWPQMNDKDKKLHMTYKKKVSDEYNNGSENPKTKIWNYFDAWDMEMRQLMQDKGLLVKKSRDPRQALGGKHF